MVGAGIHDEGPRTLFNLNERNLHRILRSYLDYYHNCRTHLSLNKDPPDPRPIEPIEAGKIVVFPRIGGLHHRYTRLAA